MIDSFAPRNLLTRKLSVLTAFLTLLSTVHATEIHWIGSGGDGLWSNGSNWDGGVPTSSDDVVVDLAGDYTVTVDGDSYAGTLQFGASSGTQTLSLPNYSLSISTAANVATNAVVDLSGGFLNGVLQIDGTMNWSAGSIGQSLVTISELGALNLQGGSQSFYSCIVTNRGITTWSASSLNGDSNGSFVNEGDFVLNASCELNGLNFTNTYNGRILKPGDSGSSTLTFYGSGYFSQQGMCEVGTNSTLVLNGYPNNPDGFRLEDGAVFTGDGSMSWDGSYWCSGNVRIENIVASTSWMGGNGTLSGPGEMNWSGTFNGMADITLASDFHLNMFSSWLYGSLHNNGTVTLSGAVNSSGSFTSGQVFNNSGTIIVSGSCELWSMNFTNTGTILKPADSGSGTLTFYGSGTFSHQGTCRAETNATLVLNAYPNNPDGYRLETGAVFTGDGSMSWDGSYWCSGNARIEKTIASTAWMGGNGTLSGPGLLNWSGTFNGMADITLAPDFHLIMFSSWLYGSLHNSGTVTLAGNVNASGSFSGGQIFNNTGTLIVGASGELWSMNFTNTGTIMTAANSGTATLTFYGSGTFSHQGTCRAEANSTLVLNAYPNNPDGYRLENGAVFTGAGNMSWDGSFWCSGNERIENTISSTAWMGGNGTLSGPGLINWSGTFNGMADITLASDFHLNMASSWLYGSLRNNGTVTLSGAVNSSGSFSSGQIFNNTGTLIVDGAGELWSMNFTNTGTILKPANSGSGTLTFYGSGTFSQQGTCRAEANSTLILNAYPNNPDGYRLEDGAVYTGAGSMSWDGSYWCGGNVRVENTIACTAWMGGNGTLSGPGVINWAGTFNGMADISLASDFHLNMFSSWLYGKLSNNGTVTLSGMVNSFGGYSSGQAFNNAGTLIISGTGELQSMDFTNTGTILKPADSGSGTLSFYGSGTFSQQGTCRVEANATLTLNGYPNNPNGYRLESGAIYTGAGNVNWDGSYWCSGNVRIENTIASAAWVGGNGTLSGPGVINWFGTFNGMADITLASDFHLNMFSSWIYGSVTNNGTVNCSGTVNSTGVFNNKGQFLLQATTTLADTGTLNNFAMGIIRNVSGNNSISWTLNNSGLLEPLQGTLCLFNSYSPDTIADHRFPLAGTAAGTDFGTVSSGAFAANGSLTIVLTNGFVPASGDSFTLMTYPSSSGAFSSTQLPALPPTLGWKTDFGTNQLVLSVGEIVAITQQPQDQTVAEGHAANFNVVATGATTYQWRFNGADLSGATTSSYTIASAQTSDVGSYSVVVGNDFGSLTSSTALLTIADSPQITAQPESRTSDAGTTATFSVAANGIGLSYQWKKGASDLSNGGNIFGATTATLTLTDVMASDVGNYSVSVTNVAGSVLSSAAHLTVNDPVITTQPQTQTKNAGTNLTLSVVAVGTSPINYQWKINGTNLADGLKIFGATTSTLTITNLIKADQGTYSVDVIGVTTVASSNAFVTVIDPAINSQPANLTVLSNQFASFTVGAGGTPTLKYQWYSTTDGGTTTTTLTGKTNATLTFANAKPIDAKGYFVIVANTLGKATSAVAQLTVNTPPTITLQPVNYIGTMAKVAGNDAAFKISANGTAPLSYQWYHNGDPISGATASNWTQVNNQAADAGTYTCVVGNITGITTTTLNTKGLLEVKADLAKPTVAFTYPAANARLTNGFPYLGLIAPTAPLTGTVTDNGLITAVTVQRIFPVLESAVTATLTGALPGSKTWSNAVELLDGTNTFKVAAYDSAGLSNVTTRSVFFVNTSALTLATNGTGSVSSVGTATSFAAFGEPTNHALLELGRNYTVLATPGFNQIFTNWTLADDSGTSYSPSNKLTFAMTSNLNLTANFVLNPMLVATGKYNGLFYETNGVNIPNIKTNSAGAIGTLSVNTNRVFSGTLFLDGKSHTLSGAFNLSGDATNVISRSSIGRSNLTVVMHLDWTGSKQISGSVSNMSVDDPWYAPLLADLAAYNAGNLTTPAAYTMFIPPADDAPLASPGGSGYSAITNTALGMTTFNGKLADGTAISRAVPISKDGNWPLYLNLYGGRGLVEGWIKFSSGSPAGTVTWIRPVTNLPPAFILYTNGFTNIVEMNGSPYVKPATGVPALSNTNLLLTVADADLADLPLEWHVQLKGSSLVVVSALPTNKISAATFNADGSFSVTFRPTGFPTNKTGYGILTQNDNKGRGAFTGFTNTGSIYLRP